ncbi:SMI1/KNR4 family protein [Actinomadura alba]|uniref:SMI1/KNR4 family protein n=1 Tax=Actinomadura alba TaxID=406431 RepID=A0ABR7LNJ0_9ACTN|nr:SMI1/KNR4 family protein [Actinomadura alba]MBC6466305.1 SMI1/KNR4 family protein [Actinomadura alba]
MVTPVSIAEKWRHGEAVRVLRELGAPDPVDSCTARLTVLVSEIAEHASSEYESLIKTRGAADPEATRYRIRIVESWRVGVPGRSLTPTRHDSMKALAELEAAVGEPLPADFRAYLRLFGDSGGLDFYEYDGLSVAQMLSRWRSLKDAHKQWTFDDWTPHELDPDNGLVQCVWWHPGWVPFASDSCGNLFCIDLAPAEHGKRGQVIPWENRSGPHGPRAWSFVQYLRKHYDTLLSVQHTYDEDGRLERPC